MDIEDIEVFIGIDVGKSEHWTTALSRDGQKVPDKTLPSNRDRLCEVCQRLQAKGQVLVVVDQPATIGALAVAMAQDMGIIMGHLPRLSMRHIAGLTLGSTKADVRDAAVIAQTARTMPHILRAINTLDKDAAALSMLTGFDLDLVRQVNQTTNQIRGLYIQIHPALERVLGSWLEHDTALGVTAARPTPVNLKRVGKARTDTKFKKRGCRWHATWANQIVLTLEYQTAVVVDTDTTAVVLPHLARQFIALHTQRADATAQVETLVQAHPFYQVLTSVPGIGVRVAAVFLAEILSETLSTGAQLVSYTGLVPVTHHSNSSIRGEHVSHGGSKRLKRAMFLSAFASLRSDLVSRAYYQRKRDQGKRYNQAVLALAHRRILTLHTTIRNGTLYGPRPAMKLPAAA